MASEKRRGSGWTDVPSNEGSTRFDDFYEQLKLPDQEWVVMRLVGDVFAVTMHWVPTFKKGSDSEAAYPMLCLKNNGDDKKCPHCAARIKKQTIYLSNAISRDEQENKPENKKKCVQPKGQEWRNKGDKFWSPIYVVRFPYGAAQKIRNLGALNKVKTAKGIQTFDLNHPKYGRDISVLLDKTQSGSGMYDIQRDDRTPLTDEEKGYLLYNLEKIYDCVPDYKTMMESLRAAYDKDALNEDNCDMKAVKKLLRSADGVDDDDDDDEDKPKKKGKKNDPKKGKEKKRPKDEDDDDLDDDELDEDEDDLDEDDDDDDKPKKKKGKDKKSKKRSVKDDDDDDELDEDDDDLDEEDDEDEDEKPKKKKGKTSKKSKKDDDDDLDDDLEDEDEDDDEDEDEDEKPKKKGKKGKPKRRSKDDDDDLDDDLEDEDEDEDEKPKKKGKKGKKSKKHEDEDDDLDDDLDDEDDDELEEEDDEDEDEKPKKKKGKKDRPTKKKRR